ncbi:hypothetical protein EV359DRAFT_64252 [Lentinula novae-zelandiae]|nr:hypothetical protein EV359DRAFT_64252 [Lentinula novae-zelandiae]
MSDQLMEDSSSEDWALMCDTLYFLFATESELTVLVRGLSKMGYLPNPGIGKLHGQLGLTSHSDSQTGTTIEGQSSTAPAAQALQSNAGPELQQSPPLDESSNDLEVPPQRSMKPLPRRASIRHDENISPRPLTPAFGISFNYAPLALNSPMLPSDKSNTSSTMIRKPNSPCIGTNAKRPYSPQPSSMIISVSHPQLGPISQNNHGDDEGGDDDEEMEFDWDAIKEIEDEDEDEGPEDEEEFQFVPARWDDQAMGEDDDDDNEEGVEEEKTEQSEHVSEDNDLDQDDLVFPIPVKCEWMYQVAENAPLLACNFPARSLSEAKIHANRHARNNATKLSDKKEMLVVNCRWRGCDFDKYKLNEYITHFTHALALPRSQNQSEPDGHGSVVVARNYGSNPITSTQAYPPPSVSGPKPWPKVKIDLRDPNYYIVYSGTKDRGGLGSADAVVNEFFDDPYIQTRLGWGRSNDARFKGYPTPELDRENIHFSLVGPTICGGKYRQCTVLLNRKSPEKKFWIKNAYGEYVLVEPNPWPSIEIVGTPKDLFITCSNLKDSNDRSAFKLLDSFLTRREVRKALDLGQFPKTHFAAYPDPFLDRDDIHFSIVGPKVCDGPRRQCTASLNRKSGNYWVKDHNGKVILGVQLQ